MEVSLMTLSNKVAATVLTKLYDMNGNSTEVDAVFMKHLETTLHSIMDATGYTEDCILEMAKDIVNGECSESFREHCVQMRRASFRIVK